MAKTYFGFAVADSMFPASCVVRRAAKTPQDVKAQLESATVIAALNPSHEATVRAATERYGLRISVPAEAPKIALETGDRFLVMSVRGLPRLAAPRTEYTSAEIAGAEFAFGEWSVD